jgi:hypothetical protein
MADKVPNPGFVPLTFRSVAGFAVAPAIRLLTVQLVVSVWVALCMVWFIRVAWYPVVEQAIGQLPPQASIQQGQLLWDGPTSVLLSESPFLSIAVHLESTGVHPSVADLQIEFGRRGLKLRSLFGHIPLPYPQRHGVTLSRTELQAWWGAWRNMLLLATALCTVGAILVSWWVLGCVAAVPVGFVVSWTNRAADRGKIWRLGAAALVPGALLMTGAILLYGLGRVSLIVFLALWVLHLVLGGIYLLVAPFWLPRRARSARPSNPFR